MRTSTGLLAIGAVALLSACASTRGPASTPMTAPAPSAASDQELPSGAGRTILQTSCTSCHGLNEVTKFRGFYGRAQWHDIVVTMVSYGAEVKQDDVEVLTDYLVQHLGRR